MSDKPLNPSYKFGFHLQPTFANVPSKGLVGVIMGSDSDWPFMQPCADTLEALEIPFELGVVSAHRTPGRMTSYAGTAESRGIRVIIACAGGSAHLPGMSASENIIPVLAVSTKRDDYFAVGSMICMPAGIPLAYMGGGSAPGKNAGAVNAALMAARILAPSHRKFRDALVAYTRQLQESVPFQCFKEGKGEQA